MALSTLTHSEDVFNIDACNSVHFTTGSCSGTDPYASTSTSIHSCTCRSCRHNTNTATIFDFLGSSTPTRALISFHITCTITEEEVLVLLVVREG